MYKVVGSRNKVLFSAYYIDGMTIENEVTSFSMGMTLIIILVLYDQANLWIQFNDR